jgi:hypothetical protein
MKGSERSVSSNDSGDGTRISKIGSEWAFICAYLLSGKLNRVLNILNLGSLNNKFIA